MEILRGFAEKFEQESVDEAYLVPTDIKSFEDVIYVLKGSKMKS